jgi:orotate phosphoribosyltransferase
LIVEDLTTTGGSVMKVVEAVKEKGGKQWQKKITTQR